MVSRWTISTCRPARGRAPTRACTSSCGCAAAGADEDPLAGADPLDRFRGRGDHVAVLLLPVRVVRAGWLRSAFIARLRRAASVMRASAATDIRARLADDERVDVQFDDLGEVGHELADALQARGDGVEVHAGLAARHPSAARTTWCSRASARPRPAVMGARWNVTSFITSTKIPPRPNISMGPNCGSRVMPRMTSRPFAAHLLDVDAVECGRSGTLLADAQHHQVEGVEHRRGAS